MLSMTFDQRLKELAKAHDAVDRLREVQQRIAEREAAAVARRDSVLRTIVLIVIVLLIFIAYDRL